MIHYDFPLIMNLDDVLPAISGKPEFLVVDKGDYTVVNYAVNMPDTFAWSDKHTEMRRECRGLIFNREREIISRPFHKFFNVGQIDETQPHRIDIGQRHRVYEKRDGSFVRPLVLNDVFHFATKMGLTDVAREAECHVTHAQEEWLRWQFADGLTPILEYTGPENQIVLRYEKPELTLLAIRDCYTGQYLNSPNVGVPFPYAAEHSPVALGGLADYLERVKSEEGSEGYVIVFDDGHRLKVKNSWYVAIHAMLDEVRADRKVLALILDEKMDDVLPTIPETDQARVREFERLFWGDVFEKIELFETEFRPLVEAFGGDRKRVALELVPTLPSEDRKFAFDIFLGKDIRECVLDKVRKSLGTERNYEEMRKWLKS